MADALNAFFGAWSETSDADRHAAIQGAMAPEFLYADPRQQEPIEDLDALDAYVAQFAANAPGWTASVVSQDNVGAFTRALVRFGGKGPDGTEMEQMGQYFIRADASGRLSQLIGFVGTGAPE